MTNIGAMKQAGAVAAGSAAKLASAEELVKPALSAAEELVGRLESARGAVRAGVDALDGVKFTKLGAQRVKPGSVANVEAAMQQASIADAVLGPAYYKAQHQIGNWPFSDALGHAAKEAGELRAYEGMGYSFRTVSPMGYVRHNLDQSLAQHASEPRALVDRARTMLQKVDDDLATKLRAARHEAVAEEAGALVTSTRADLHDPMLARSMRDADVSDAVRLTFGRGA